MELAETTVMEPKEVEAEPVPSGPPDRPEADFSHIQHPGTRNHAWKEYQRTLADLRREGQVTPKTFKDFEHLVFPPGYASAVFEAHKRALGDIRAWQDEQREAEAERQKEIERRKERERRSREMILYQQERAARQKREADERERQLAEEAARKAAEEKARLEWERANPPPQPVLIRGVALDAGLRSRLNAYEPVVPRLDIARAPDALPEEDTERLLNALIGECHFLMREVAFRSMCQCPVLDDRLIWMNTAMKLATTGGKVAKSVAQLRHGPPVKQTHHNMTVDNRVAGVVQGEGG